MKAARVFSMEEFGGIQSGIPIPKKRNGPQTNKYRPKLERMQVGQCFFVDHVKTATTAFDFAAQLGIKIVTRREGSGIRIWRTA
jgi:hypothetical protein